MELIKLSKDIQGFISKPSTQQFLDAARQFIDLLESPTIAHEEFYLKAHSALIRLYSGGFNLEVIDLKFSNENTDFDREAILEGNNKNLISELKEAAFYWEVFDPTYSETDGVPGSGWAITDREATQGWLVDDFSDIYRDLKIELFKIEKINTNEAVEDALWELKWGFTHHWENHCINALRYLHYLYYDGKKAL